jgi:hypothetical protein
MATKKSLAMQLGSIYDSQASNRKQGALPVRAPLPPIALLSVAQASWNTQKYQNNSWKLLRFDLKLPKTAFFDKNL